MNERCVPSGNSQPRSSLIGGRIATLALAMMMTSCDSHSSDPQLQWGWVTNCEGPEFSRFGRLGPERPVFRITDQLVVAVPKTNHPDGGSIDREPRECRHISDLPPADHLEFVIQGDWSAGYDVADIPTVAGGLKDFRPDSVWVRVERERPSKFSPEEQQKIDQLLKDGQRRHYDETREIGGLTCLITCPLESCERDKIFHRALN